MPDILFPGIGQVQILGAIQKPCSAKQWNEGVLAVSSVTQSLPLVTNFNDIPVSIVSDGAGGAFVLATENDYSPDALGAFVLRAINASGIPTGEVYFDDPRAWIGVLGVWPQYAMVGSRKGACIVVQYRYQSPPKEIKAQRYDVKGRPLWGKGTKVANLKNQTTFRTINLAAEPDGQGGVIAAWVCWDYQLQNLRIEMQHISVAGRLVWGANPIVFGTVKPSSAVRPPAPWIQLVSDGSGGAHVIAPQDGTAGVNYVAYRVDDRGNVSAPTSLVLNVNDDWTAIQRIRRAVTDGVGGFYLAYTDISGNVHVLRYSFAAAISWDINIGRPIHPWAFQVREDDQGGLLVSFVSVATFPQIELMRISSGGKITWDINANQTAPLSGINIPAGASYWSNETWARLSQPVPDAGGGSILIFQNDSYQNGNSILFSACFDSTGAMQGPIQEVTANASVQELPVVNRGEYGTALVAWADDIRSNTNGLDVYVQKVGCCPLLGLQPPIPFPCEIIDFSDTGFQEFGLILPCGNEGLQYGFMPMARFFTTVRGLDYPGSITNRDVQPPDWMRINFFALPENFHVRIFSTKGKRIADAQDVPGSANAKVVTFQPSAKEEQLLFFSAEKHKRRTRYRIRVTSEWGHGKAPSAKTNLKVFRRVKKP